MVILHDSFVLNAEDGIEIITPDKSFVTDMPKTLGCRWRAAVVSCRP